MGNVIDFPKKSINVSRQYCSCGCILEYWLGSDDLAYGVCTACSLDFPDTFEPEEEDEE